MNGSMSPSTESESINPMPSYSEGTANRWTEARGGGGGNYNLSEKNKREEEDLLSIVCGAKRRLVKARKRRLVLLLVDAVVYGHGKGAELQRLTCTDKRKDGDGRITSKQGGDMKIMAEKRIVAIHCSVLEGGEKKRKR